jgi:hypothetical protein
MSESVHYQSTFDAIFQSRWKDHISSLKKDLGSDALVRIIKLGAVRELKLSIGLEFGDPHMHREGRLQAMKEHHCRVNNSARHACIDLLKGGPYDTCKHQPRRTLPINNQA